MIVILSINTDTSTTRVLAWISFYGKEFIRINDTSKIMLKQFTLNNDNDVTLIGAPDLDREINLSQVRSYWYRRGEVNINYLPPDNEQVATYSKKEIATIEEYIHFLLEKENKHTLNKLVDTESNKLIYLKEAVKLGLYIPSTIIATTKQEVKDFYERSVDKKIITKALWNGFSFTDNSFQYLWPTVIFDYPGLEKDIPEKFFPTLFQEYVEKKYELRIFYLKGTFFASVIFSQNDEKTRVDFRNYNTDKQNRVNPYKLPVVIEEKLRMLMRKFNYDSASIDMIYTPKGEYIFLEVNTIGQFHQVSYPCNYYLEKHIASYLSEYE